MQLSLLPPSAITSSLLVLRSEPLYITEDYILYPLMSNPYHVYWPFLDPPTISCTVWTPRSYAQSVQLRLIHISKLLSGYGRLRLTAVPLTVCGMKYLQSNINN